MPDNSIAHIIMENILYFDNFTLLLDPKIRIIVTQ